MFTKVQGQELIDYTTSTWATINGVNGRKFTNKTNSSKSIFIPANGFWDYATNYGAGSYGNYWSTMWNSLSSSWGLSFGSDSIIMHFYESSYGRSIRPVAPPKPW